MSEILSSSACGNLGIWEFGTLGTWDLGNLRMGAGVSSLSSVYWTTLVLR